MALVMRLTLFPRSLFELLASYKSKSCKLTVCNKILSSFIWVWITTVIGALHILEVCKQVDCGSRHTPKKVLQLC